MCTNKNPLRLVYRTYATEEARKNDPSKADSHDQNHNITMLFLHRYEVLVLLTVLSFFGADSINVCEYKQCRPDCMCDARFDDVCAMEYGNYGWAFPESGSEYLYRHMRPDVSGDANRIGILVFFLTW